MEKKLPATFGLKGFPGKVFRINDAYSYIDEQGVKQIVLDIQYQDGTWQQFGRDTEANVNRQRKG